VSSGIGATQRVGSRTYLVKPQRIATHRVERCSACGQYLDNVHPARIEHRQVHDLHCCESFSQGTLANFHAVCAARLEPIEAAILKQVAASPVVGFNETGVRASVSLHWLHTVCTKALTWYHAHKKFGTQAMDAAGILPIFQGCAIHDFWKPYFRYDCQHALCIAHLLRELVFLHE